jgi:preprotein translocase subunit YajC
LYATFLATANDMVKFADPKTALQLTISVPVSSHSVPLQQCGRVMDAVRALQPTGSLDEDLALMAVAWLDVKVVQNSFVYVTVADSAARLVSCLAGCSEKVARAVTASANIMAFMKRAATDGPRLFLFEKLVFWWAQVQWQITNQPTAKRVLDVKSAFEADGLSFRAVKAPAPFLLDVPAVVKFVSERLTTRLGSGCTFARTITTILRMVFQVAPEFILKDPAAHLCVIENAELLPEVCAAVIAAGPVPAASGPVPTGTGTAAAAAAMRGTPAFVVGAKVTAKYRGRGKWFPGKIVSVEGTEAGALYDVLYDDGDKDDRLREEFVKVQQGARSPAFAVGDKVTIQSGRPGKIVNVADFTNGDVLYDVQLDGDDMYFVVREKFVKAQGAETGAGAPVASLRGTPAFAVGDKVTVQSGRSGKVVNIAGFNGGVFYDVQLDKDVVRVREEHVKAQGAGTGAGAAVAAMRGTPAFAVGDKVTAEFRGKWHPAKITNVVVTDSGAVYDVVYDAGGGYKLLREEFVRAQEGGRAGGVLAGAGAPCGGAGAPVSMEMVD